MKNYILILFCFLIFISCGTRKRTLEKKHEKINYLRQNDIKTIKQNDIFSNAKFIKKSSTIIYKPIDSTKPMKVNGKEYDNTILEETISETISETIVEDHSTVEVDDKSSLQFHIEKKSKNIDIERDNSFGFWDWFWMLLAIAIVFLIIWKRASIFSYIKLLIKNF